MNSVSINLRTDEVVIKIDDNAKQEDVIEELDKKMKDLKKMYQDEKTPIRVTGKILTNKELEEIREIIKSYHLLCKQGKMSEVTKRALEQSLKNLLLKKPLTKITINDITEDFGIRKLTIPGRRVF